MESDTLGDDDDATLKAKSKRLQIRAAQVKQLYSQGRSGFIGALLGAIVLTVALWGVVPQFRLILWLAGYVLASLPRQILIISYQRSSPPSAHVIWWEKWFVVLTFTAALFWGLAGVLLFPVYSMPHQFLLAIFVIGISCGAALVYWPNTFCYVPAILVELLPLSGRFIYEGDQVHVVLGMIIAFFAVILIVMAHHMHSMNSEILESEFEISSLADSLQKGQEELEFKVEERTAELTSLNKRLLGEITGRKRHEEAQKRLATAIEQSIESVIITDRNGKIQYINPAFEQISGYRREEVIGRDTRFLKSDRLDSSYYKDQLTAIRSGKPWKGRLLSQRKDGQIFYEDVAISPVRDSSGEIVNFVDVGHDVTENVELQMQLLQAQKMEAVGTLAGGIAHDFNNLLQVVLGYSEVMLLRKKEGEPDYSDLHKIYQAGKRGADLVKSLLTFSRKVETKYVPLDLNQEITSVRNLLSRTIPKTVRIDLHLSGNLESIQGDSSQIGQILMNLGVNARDAMPDGGTLSIETGMVELDRDYCQAHLETKPGSYVLLTVSDSGHGMDKETLSHIFEPFFTTKETGKGTGLGLATVYGIVKQHGGHITCCSEPGLGTTFKIYFPAIVKEVDSETSTVERPIPGGTETILLVDDEETLRDLGETS